MSNLLPMKVPSRVYVLSNNERTEKVIIPISTMYSKQLGWYITALDKSTNQVINLKFSDIEPKEIWK